MKITPEMMAKFEQCQSAEEIINLAQSQNLPISPSQAAKALELLHSEDLSDEVLEAVNGGDGGFSPAGLKALWEDIIN